MNRVCPECGQKTCKIAFNTLLDSIYCTECVTRFEYSKSSKKNVGLVFGLVSFLSVIILFKSQSWVFALGFIIVVMAPALYLAVWNSKISVAGFKGVRKRIRDKYL